MFNLKSLLSKAVDVQKVLIRGIHRTYYDALGLTPKASQADIKQAYYNLSMQFHPDKSEGSEEKFKEITSAYEVLGNVKLRRLYDRGMLTKGDPSVEDETVDSAFVNPQQKFYNSRSTKSKVPATGRTQAYDFDEWSRAHYAETFIRRETAKSRHERKIFVKENRKNQMQVEAILFFLGVLFIVSSLLATNSISNPDKPSPRSKSDKS